MASELPKSGEIFWKGQGISKRWNTGHPGTAYNKIFFFCSAGENCESATPDIVLKSNVS